MKNIILSLISGTLFGLGLDIGGMTNPSNITGFLDIAGEWNPSLLFVMIGAVSVTFIGYRLTFKKSKPIWASQFQLPTKTDLDGRILSGAALFGIGWGLGGYCPGPAISSLSNLNSDLITFVAAMILGMLTVKVVSRIYIRPESTEADNSVQG